jgi:hypothetical protein
MVRARNAKKLATLVDKLNALQKQTGELKEVTEREHKGAKYFCRTERKQANYYFLRGPILLYTGQEDLLKKAIERDRTEAAEAVPPMARKLKDLRLEKALVALVVNPRVFDDAIARGETQASRTFATCWKALQGLGVGLHVEKDIQFELTLQAKTDTLPLPLRKFLTPAGKPSELWATFPDNALLAVGGRVDLSALYGFFTLFLERSTREKFESDLKNDIEVVLGKDVVKELLPALGPDWGLCVTAPPREGKQWAPKAVLALKIARGEESDPIDESVVSALATWARLGALAHNKKHPQRPISLKTVVEDRIKVRYLQGDSTFPLGVRPAFVLKSGYLVLATSPAEIKAFKGGSASQAASNSVPLLRLSLKDWRAYLKDRRDELAAALATQAGTTKDKSREKIDGLRTSLALFDRLELRQEVSKGQVTFRLTIQPTKPLKKGAESEK